MSQNLDRAKPLWEMWVVEGLGEGRWAMVSKVHHAMVDGIASTDLLTVLLDREREPEPTPAPEPWAPESPPGSARLLGDALVERAKNPFGGGEPAWRRTHQPAAVRAAAARHLARADRVRRRGAPVGTSLNGPLGPHRRWTWARGRLSDVQQVRKALGGTVNDVVLAAITGGFRDLVAARGESVDRTLRTLVPVSVRRPGERGSYNNRVSAIFAELPIGIAGPGAAVGVDPFADGRAEGVQGGARGRGADVDVGLRTADAARARRPAGQPMPQRNINTGTTNVPGPQFPLYLAGRRMLESFPYIPLFAQVRVAVAIFSYDGALGFGISGDYDTAPDVEVLAKGIESGLADLVALVPMAEPVTPGAAAESAAGEGAAGDAPEPATAS